MIYRSEYKRTSEHLPDREILDDRRREDVFKVSTPVDYHMLCSILMLVALVKTRQTFVRRHAAFKSQSRRFPTVQFVPVSSTALPF